jgi:hypothetical protein
MRENQWEPICYPDFQRDLDSRAKGFRVPDDLMKGAVVGQFNADLDCPSDLGQKDKTAPSSGIKKRFGDMPFSSAS